jgi:hypothetical protein
MADAQQTRGSKDMGALQGKVAVVTGASRGIGRAIALALGRAGAQVAVTCTQQRTAAEAVVAELQQEGAGTGRVYQFDVANADATTQAFIDITKDFGRLDILVCNAGVRRDQLLVRMKPEEWDTVIQTTGEVTAQRSAQLVHTARVMFETRWARYSDPRNLDWEFDVDMNHASKWERHAWSAYLDLVATESECDLLLERVRVLEEALRPLVSRLIKMMENGSECDCPAEGHLCGWSVLNYEVDVARAALAAKGE